MDDLKLSIDIPLSVPAEEREGDNTKRHTSLTMGRPKTRHVKRVVSLLGPDFVRNLMADEGEAAGTVSGRDLLAEALALLVDDTRLDGMRDVIADLCGVSAAVIDDLDPADLVAVMKALAGFFPELRSIVSANS
ncbi:phage tail assembly protein [Breoghania sp. JC706]|uniref:phage tail assembly protein n=1 Tax=Breoghania sp. JC706 TaxID=3117732 RepID=UPI003009E015